MSERAPQGPEFNTLQETTETTRAQIEKLHEEAERESTHGSKEHVSEIQASVEKHALHAHEVPGVEKEQPQNNSQSFVGRDLKSLNLNRTLVRIRKRLKAPEKALSVIIHQPTVERISNIASVTIARPAGLLGGGLLALLGTAAVLYLTRTYGYEFNYLVFVLSFVAGFALGSLIEIIIKLARRK